MQKNMRIEIIPIKFLPSYKLWISHIDEALKHDFILSRDKPVLVFTDVLQLGLDIECINDDNVVLLKLSAL